MAMLVGSRCASGIRAATRTHLSAGTGTRRCKRLRPSVVALAGDRVGGAHEGPRHLSASASASAGRVRPPPPPKRVLVTGGANGIGRAIVDHFAQAGAMVAYADLEERGAGALLGFGSEGMSSSDLGHDHEHTANAPLHLPCDCGDAEQVEAAVATAVAQWGGLDVLVNNVGAHFEAGVPCHDLSVDAWDRVQRTNLRSYFLFSKFVLRDAMVPQKSGAIVNVGSVHGFQNGPGLCGYAATKGGILALTRQLAVEYAPIGIRVNAVVPGTINTPMNQNFMAPEDELTDRSPIGRWGLPSEVASVVGFVASPQASFVTGESIAVDGGLLSVGVWAANEAPSSTKQ